MLVLDATAALELLLARRGAETIMDAMVDHAPVYMAPGTDLAAIDILRHYRRLGELAEERAGRAIDDLAKLPAQRYNLSDLPDLANRTWQLTEQLLADAASSIALAEQLGATLVTCDPALGAAEHSAMILLVE